MNNISNERGLGRLIGHDPSMIDLREQVRRIAPFAQVSVLVFGETGTGKELVAQAIHESSCPGEPFISVNCAAVPHELFEAELFGHVRGAFTHADDKRAGLMEQAGAGTLFLDEIGELPLSLQPKLLRTLETRLFRRVGSPRELPLRARVISATHVPLADSPERFRSDLYFRISGYTVQCPPLRSRKGDLVDLATHFAEEFCRSYDMPRVTFSAEAMDLLLAHDFPGNVRELRSVVETAIVGAISSEISASELEYVLRPKGLPSTLFPPRSSERPGPVSSRPTSDWLLRRLVGPGRPFESLAALERHVIEAACLECNGSMSQTARLLGIARSTLRDKLRRYEDEGGDPLAGVASR